MFTFSLLVNSLSLEAFTTRLMLSYTVFLSKNIDKIVEASYNTLQELLKSLGNEDNDELMLDLGDDSMEEDSGDKVTLVQDDEESIKVANEAFKTYFSKKLQFHQCHDSTMPLNECYNPRLVEILEAKWLGQVPFWTCVLRGI